jgi:2,3-bisphosphoglycerate-dependent phosphoglycerate mutase
LNLGTDEMTDRLLVLVRHGQSEWNLKNLFTGWKDVDLTEKGVEEARAAGRKLKAQGLSFDVASRRCSSARSARSICCSPRWDSPAFRCIATGAQRARLRRPRRHEQGRRPQEWGEEQVLLWRRSYDVQPPGGESLKDTVARTLPYFIQEILPAVLNGKRTIVSAHGNSLRALVMVLEKLSPEGILKRELATGVPIVYRSTPTRRSRPSSISRRLSHPARFPAEHGALARDAPVIAGELAAFSHHAMARHHERDRVAPDRGADRAAG